MLRLSELAPLVAHYDQLGEVFYALDGDWRIAVANDAALRFAGLSREEGVGRSYWDVVPGARGGPLGRAFEEARRTGAVVAVEVESSLHPGLYVRVIAAPLADGLAITLRDVTEQRASQDAQTRRLLNTEEHLRLAAEAALIGTWEVHPQANVRHWSAQFRSIIGVPDDAHPDDRLFASLIHPSDRDRVEDMYRRAYAGESGGGYAAEFRIRRASDGARRWVSARGRVFFDGEGRAIRGIGALYDITTRKEAEEALKDSEERFRLAAEAFQGGVADYDLRTGKVTRTRRQLEIVGEEDLPPSPDAWISRIHPDDRPAFRKAGEEIVGGRSSHFEAEYRVRHRDGRWVWVWDRGMAMRDASGALHRVISSMIEITARKQAEDALRESEARFRHLADSAPALIWLTDAEGRLTFVNMHFGYMFGRGPEGIVPRGWRELVHPDDMRAFIGRFVGALKERAPFAHEVRVLDKEGSVRWLRTDAVPRLDDAGAFLGYTGCAVDITEAKVSQAQQEILINELNHRVKNTLATVQAIAAQSLRSERDAGEARQAFESRLFALSRAHDVLTQESWQAASLRDIVERAVEPYGGPGHRFAIVGPDVRLTPHSALAFAMALQELATNAAKYGALSVPGGDVAISWRLEPTPGGACLSFQWQESGGPPVRPPKRRGFGSRLIERTLAEDTGGAVEIAYSPGGVELKLTMPLPSAA
ncbi:MAG TPA: PAS domain S-box protein [Beijerinckiaceae bacterium]